MASPQSRTPRVPPDRGGGLPGHAVVALDLGSSSVRAVLGRLEDDVVILEEVHRVHHAPVRRDGHLVWDLNRVLQGVNQGLAAAVDHLGRAPDSVGVDGWGVDYGLLDASGALIRPPRSYRDERGSRATAEVRARVGEDEAWRRTGVASAGINTLNQLVADLLETPYLVERVATVLPLPDLVAARLGGDLRVGRAIASTTQLAQPGAAAWDPAMLRDAGVPARWLPPIVSDATRAGTVREGPAAGAVIVRPGGHDTACAVHALGLGPTDVRLFISCGSWSLIGATVPQPVLTSEARGSGLTNEVRTDGGVRLLRNLTGLWLLQELQRAWSVADIVPLLEEAREAESLGVVVDPDDEVFASPGGMPDRLATWCVERYGLAPRGRGQVTCLVLESLACAHAEWADRLHGVVGTSLDCRAPIHVVGGGVRNELLMALTATACHRPVIAGPAEASALGNVLAQLETLGAIPPERRGEIVRASVRTRTIQPSDDGARLDRMRERLRTVMDR